MARDADALLIRKWAATGDVETPEDRGLTRTLGWPADFSVPGGRQPTREVFNQLFRELSALAHEINTRGLLDWDAGVDYVHPAFVRGSNGIVYTSVQGSSGNDPTTDNGTYWAQFGATGWSPRVAVVQDGYRSVFRITGWVGGVGDPPGSGQYIGASGLVSTAAEAVDLKIVPPGGTDGQVLVKQGSSDYGARWRQMFGGYKLGGSGVREITATTRVAEDTLILGVYSPIGGFLRGTGFSITVASGEQFAFPIPIAIASGQQIVVPANSRLFICNESDLEEVTP